MQKISWEEVFRLTDGLDYDIDFFRDFSTIFLGEVVIESIPVQEIVKYLIPTSRDETCDVSSEIDYWQRQKIIKAAAKASKEARKEREWEEKRNRNSKKRVKRAERKLKEVLWELG